MYAGIVSLTLLGLTLGFLLGFAARHLKVESDPLVEEINALMPGTNCGQCGFPGCNAAAEAVVSGAAPVTMCPPGGKSMAEKIAAIMGVQIDLSDMDDSGPMIAWVDEVNCIGCTKCIKVCPTDAIVGAPKHIHAVIEDACTGCKACIDVCPTACLHMLPVKVTLNNWRWDKPAAAA